MNLVVPFFYNYQCLFVCRRNPIFKTLYFELPDVDHVIKRISNVYLESNEYHDVYYLDSDDSWYPVNLSVLQDVWKLLQGHHAGGGGGGGGGGGVKTAITSWSQFTETGNKVNVYDDDAANLLVKDINNN